MEALVDVLISLYFSLHSISGVLAAVLVVASAVLYGVSVMVAEPQTKARYQNWSIQMFLGAISIFLIIQIGSFILASFGITPPEERDNQCVKSCCDAHFSDWCDKGCNDDWTILCQRIEDNFNSCVSKCQSHPSIKSCGDCGDISQRRD